MDNKKYKGVRTEVPDAVEDKVESVPVSGGITNCICSNIRKEPRIDSESLCVVDKGTEVMVSLNESTTTWYKVILASGIEGFCMKAYVSIR